MRLGKASTANLSQSRAIGLCIYVREADDWKIRVTSWNTAPDSVILVDKSFAPQPAATPSPTASPSGQ